jgi:hypothetical protein
MFNLLLLEATSVDWISDCIYLSRYRLRPAARYPLSRNDLSRSEWDTHMARTSAKELSSQSA